MGLLRAIIQWTDRIAAEDTRSRGLLLFPLLPWLLVGAHRHLLTIIIASILSLAALVFVAWRFWVVTKAQMAESDRAYDEVGKFELSSEYHETESATAAADRKRKGQS